MDAQKSLGFALAALSLTTAWGQVPVMGRYIWRRFRES